MSIYRLLLLRQAEQHPRAIALSAPGRPSLTYARLHTRVGEVVATLNALGVGRNHWVAIVLPNGPEMAVAFLGASGRDLAAIVVRRAHGGGPGWRGAGAAAAGSRTVIRTVGARNHMTKSAESAAVRHQ